MLANRFPSPSPLLLFVQTADFIPPLLSTQTKSKGKVKALSLLSLFLLLKLKHFKILRAFWARGPEEEEDGFTVLIFRLPPSSFLRNPFTFLFHATLQIHYSLGEFSLKKEKDCAPFTFIFVLSLPCSLLFAILIESASTQECICSSAHKLVLACISKSALHCTNLHTKTKTAAASSYLDNWSPLLMKTTTTMMMIITTILPLLKR